VARSLLGQHLSGLARRARRGVVPQRGCVEAQRRRPALGPGGTTTGGVLALGSRGSREKLGRRGSTKWELLLAFTYVPKFAIMHEPLKKLSSHECHHAKLLPCSFR
jgi:hypothetical protein